MVSKVIIIGRVGKDPESVGKSSFFPVATSYKDETTWHDIVAYGSTKEFVDKSLKKGMLVYIEGRISKIKKNDVTYTNVIINNIRVIDWGNNNSSSQEDSPF